MQDFLFTRCHCPEGFGNIRIDLLVAFSIQMNIVAGMGFIIDIQKPDQLFVFIEVEEGNPPFFADLCGYIGVLRQFAVVSAGMIEEGGGEQIGNGSGIAMILNGFVNGVFQSAGIGGGIKGIGTIGMGHFAHLFSMGHIVDTALDQHIVEIQLFGLL